MIRRGPTRRSVPGSSTGRRPSPTGRRILGVVITMAAIIFGAPFWWDNG
jgi:hypothetical protein